MTASIKAGLRAATRHPKLLFLIWAWYALLALVPTLPAWSWWNAALGSSPEGAAVLKRFGMGVFLDLTRSEGVNGLGLLVSATVAVALVGAVSSVFVFGGILEVLGSEDERRTFMHRFYRGGGHFFWRFFRLALTAIFCLVIVAGAVTALVGAITAPMSNSEWEPAGILAGLANVAAFVLVAALFLLALDYARIRVARDDSRAMVKAYVAGLGFVLRRVLTTYGMAVALIALLVAIVAGYLAYETNAPAAGTWAAIVVLFLLQQVVVFWRVFVRVALVGAERHYYTTSLPASVPVPVPVIDAAPAEAPAIEPPVPSGPEQSPMQT